MAAVAECCTREISSALQHRMGCRRVLGMVREIGGVAGDTLAASRLAEGAADQRAIGGAMTGLTGIVYLAAANKRGCGRYMAT